MASCYPQDIDFLKVLSEAKDVKAKLAASKDFITFLADPSSDVHSVDFMKIIDLIIPWIRGSNFKVSQAGLDMLLQMCDRMKSNFKILLPLILNVIIDRLGDSKEAVRDRCRLLILKMIEKKAIAPQNVLEKMIPCFTSKNMHIKCEVLKCLSSTIDLYGSNNVNLRKFLPFVARLMTDSNFSIRENAITCLLTFYRHVGDKLKDFLKADVSGCIPSPKLQQILKKLDDFKLSKELLPSAVIIDQYSDVLTTEVDKPNRQDQVDAVAVGTAKESVSVKPSVKSLTGRKNFKSTFQQHVTPSGSSKKTSTDTLSSVYFQSTCSSKSKKLNSGNKSGTSLSAGAVDEDYFIRAIEGSIKVQELSRREIGSQIMEIKEIVGNASVDWYKRVEALKKLRGLIVAGAENFEDFPTQMSQLESSIELAVRDLRSQVVREACITISFMAMKLENKFEYFAERILPQVVPLLMSAAKIISSSGLICLQLVLQYTHSVRLLPTITYNLLSKSKEIRKVMCKLINLIINTWPYQTLKKCSFILEDGIKKGIADADSEARNFARQAYWAFHKHFPEQADSILKNTDPAYQRIILNEGSSTINCSSNTTLTSQSTLGTTRSFQQELPEERSKDVMHTNLIFTLPPRSLSAINFPVAQQVKSEAREYVQPHRKVSSETSLLHRRIIFTEEGEVSFNSNEKYTGQARDQVSKNYQQSGSSASMSSRKTLHTLNLSSASNFSVAEEAVFSSSVHCVDNISSRLSNTELKMNSDGSSPVERKISSTNCKNPLPSSKALPVVKEIFFQPAAETESVVSECLSNSRSGSQQKNVKNRHGAKELKKIILNCGSTHWSDRKEALVGLKIYLEAGNLLKPLQIRRMTGHFTKMFVDSHTKDFGLFLSTLDCFVVAHKSDLNFWLYVLLTRLLNKLGVDLLASINKKIHKSLDTVRKSFSNDILILVVLRYISDATQTHNSRVKIAACNYLTKLAAGIDMRIAVLLSSTDQFKDAMTSTVTKMVEWTMDSNIKTDSNLIKATQNAIIALFNLDQSKTSSFLSCLPKEYEDAVKNLIHLESSHSSDISVETGSNCSSSILSSGILLGRFIVGTTNVSDLTQKSRSKKSFPSENEVENTNHNDVCLSVWQNKGENQHMGFRLGVKNLDHEESAQLSSDKTNSRPVMQSTEDSPIFETHTDSLALPGRKLSTIISSRILLGNCLSDTISLNSESQISLHNIDENEMITKILESVKLFVEGDNFINQNCHFSYEEIKILLTQLVQIVGENKFITISDHFKSLLRIILTHLDSNELTLQSLVLSLLTEMIKKRELVDLFNDYVELLVLKVFKSFKNGNKDVQRSADSCATAIATELSPELVIRVVIPLISAEDYPINVCAIKSLTKVIETQGRDPVLNYLTDIMPGLIHAYDSEESSVRKSTVFCMVALHVCLGEELLKPYLSCLCGSKLKLLQIYIKRAEEHLFPTL